MNENIRKEYEKLKKQVEDFREIHRTLADIATQASEQQKNELICGQFRKITGAEETTLFLTNSKTGQFQFRIATGETCDKYAGGFFLSAGDEWHGGRQPVLKANHSKTAVIQTEDKTYDFVDKFVMVVPISVSSMTYGVFVCEYNRACTIDEGVMEQLDLFLNQAALFYQSLYEIQKLEEKARSLELLYEIGNKLGSIRNEERLLDAVLESIVKYIPVDRCSLMIIDEKKKHLRMKRAIGINDVDIGKIKVPLGMGIAGHVAMGTRPLLIKDISAEEHLISMVPHKNNFRTNSLLVVPLVSSGEVIGVINASNRKDGLPFSEDDMELLSKIGSEIAAVLQRSYMALQLKKARELDRDIRRSAV